MRKSQRKRIIFELAEADVGQHISRLRPVVRLINALGARVAVTQAGLTLVSTRWIKELDVELLKLHPGLVRNIENARKTSCWYKAWWKRAKERKRKYLPQAYVHVVNGRC